MNSIANFFSSYDSFVNYIFWKVVNPKLLSRVRERIQNKLNFEETDNFIIRETGKTVEEWFDQHFIEWEQALNNSNEPLKRNILKEITKLEKEKKYQNNLFEHKVLWLTARITEIQLKSLHQQVEIINLGNKALIIDEKAVFHIVFGHYLRFYIVNLPERNKSTFYTHNDLEFIQEIRDFAGIVGLRLELDRTREEIFFQKNDKYFALIISQLNSDDYELITYYEIDRPEKIESITNDYQAVSLNENYTIFCKI